MSAPKYSIGYLCVSTIQALGHGVADWVRERHLDFEAGIRYRSPAGRLYAYLWWLGLIFAQVVLALTLVDTLIRYSRSVCDLARGEQYLAAKDYATAEACFDAALRSYPYAVAPYQYEGQLMLHRYFAGAEPDHFASGRGTRSGDPPDREKLVYDGIAFLNIAIQLENKRTLPLIIRKQEAKISDAYFWRGRGRLHLGEWEKGITDFSNTIRIQPEHAGAYFYRACCYFALRKLDAANADFDQAMTLDPKLGSALAEVIPYQKTSLELERMITDFTRQISNVRRDPTQCKELARLHVARGDAYLLKNDLNAALADYSRSLEIDNEAEVTGRISLVRKIFCEIHCTETK